MLQYVALEMWRRGRDSNPRYPCEYAAFRVRCIRPLCHLSKPLETFTNRISERGRIRRSHRSATERLRTRVSLASTGGYRQRGERHSSAIRASAIRAVGRRRVAEVVEDFVRSDRSPPAVQQHGSGVGSFVDPASPASSRSRGPSPVPRRAGPNRRDASEPLVAAAWIRLIERPAAPASGAVNPQIRKRPVIRTAAWKSSPVAAHRLRDIAA